MKSNGLLQFSTKENSWTPPWSFNWFFVAGVSGLNVEGVARRFTTKTLFAKPVIKCTTFVVSLARYVANNCLLGKSFTSSPVTMDLFAKITTSIKVRLFLESKLLNKSRKRFELVFENWLALSHLLPISVLWVHKNTVSVHFSPQLKTV